MQLIKTLYVLLALFALTVTALAIDPAFYLSFEDGADANISVGNSKANVTGNPQYEEAKLGDGALLSGIDWLAFETEKNINAEVGTVMFWVKLSKDSSELTSQEEFFSMYIDNDNRMRLHLDNNDFGIHWFYKIGGQSGIADKANIGWKKGEWHHMIATWQRDKPLILYLDDEKITGANSKVLDPLPQFFYVGSYHGASSFLKGVMDEFYIFHEYDVTEEPSQFSVQPVGKLAGYWGKIRIWE